MHLFVLFVLAATTLGQVIKGFNSGGVGPYGIKHEADFVQEFNKFRHLGTKVPFTSARFFTMVQAGTVAEPVEAFRPAIQTKTTLLLGLWASSGQQAFNAELGALKKAIDTYGKEWKNLVVGISVGSEDLYRITPTGIKNKSSAGTGPKQLINYIQQVRQLIKGTPAAGTKVGHVDTWTAWVNGSNFALIDHVDFIGFDSYPYYEDTRDNTIQNARQLFFESLDQTRAVAKGKPIWVTETGWPVSGPQEFNKAVASIPNAKKFYDDVGCSLFGKLNTWWFELDDHKPDPKAISFSVIKPHFGAPLFDLKCPA